MAKQAAFGSTLTYSPASYPVVIAQIGNITGPGISTDSIDVTTHDSTSAHRQFVAGLVDAGEVSFDFQFDPAASAASGTVALGLMEAHATNRTVATWAITFPDSSTRTFSAFVTSWSANAPVDGAVTGSCSMKITGVITKA